MTLKYFFRSDSRAHSPGPFGPRYTSQSDFIAQYATMNAGTPMGPDVMPTVINAALGGFSTVGSYVSTGGFKAVVTRNDLNQPCPSAGSCSVWATAEPVTGALDGAAMPPLRQNDAPVPTLSVFDAAVTYRNLPFVAASPVDTSVKNIKTRRYTVDPMAWKNASSVPANANYRQVEGDGLLPIASVKQGAPIYISQPHFTGADATLVQAKVRGLAPDTTGSGQYAFYIDVDPITGRTMQAFKRVQVNVGLSKAMLNRPDISGTYLAAGTIFMPSFWGEETAVISDADAASFVTALYTPVSVGVALPIVLLVVGLLLLVAGLVCLGLGAAEIAADAAAGGSGAGIGVAMTSIATKNQ